MRKPSLFVLLAVLLLPNAALAVPRESPPGGGLHGQHQDRDDPQPRSAESDHGTFDWIAFRLEPFLAFVLPQAAGPDADPSGATQAPPREEPVNESDAGPGADSR
jgi:hypothetical protein